MEVNDAKRLRELETENNKLKRLLADWMLEVEAIKDVLSINVVKPADKKRVVTHLIECHRISERLASCLAGLSRTTYRYLACSGGDLELRARMKTLTVEYPRYGYLILHSLLKSEGLVVNKKRIYGVYTEESLQV